MQLTFPSFDENELALLKQCLESRWVTQGPLVGQFEKLVAQRHRARNALATTSCTAALHLATLALGLRPGDEVIVPALTWATSAHAAEYVGAKAVFVDIDPNTFNIDPKLIEAAITENTKAIVAVHLFGLAADMDAINHIAKKYNLAVIEDAACAIATTYQGKPVGVLGDIGCFSFHPRKIVTTGEGGMVTTNRDELALLIDSYRNHGASDSGGEPEGPWSMSEFNELGFNLRLSDIQAAVGVAQFAKLDAILQERRQAAYRYSELLADVDELVLPTSHVDTSGHNFQSYVIRVKQSRDLRNKVMLALAEQDIQTRPGTHAVHCLGYYRRKYNLKPDDFPIAAMCEHQTITLPIFPGITIDDQRRVVNIIKQTFLQERNSSVILAKAGIQESVEK